LRLTRIVVVVLTAIVGLACSGSGGSAPAKGAPDRATEVSSWLFATRGVLVSWVDGKIAPEAAIKNLEATQEMLRRETSAPNADPRITQRIAKAQALIASARSAVQKDDKGAALDAAASLSDVGHDIRKAVPKS